MPPLDPSRSAVPAAPVARLARRALAALVLISMAGCGKPLPALPNDAYVWQRTWTPAVAAAIDASRGLVASWHVLAAELDARGRWVDVTPDASVLTAAHGPVVAVVRFDGALSNLDDAASIAHIATLLDAWQREGIAVAGVEIDYDCATARLAGYQRFLGALRERLAVTSPGMRLSITALPTWLDSPALDSLLAQADEAVLQVHAVMNPVRGLFDEDRAQAWMRAFARRTHHPWRVALPTYGTRVTWGPDGRVTGIESERPTLQSDDLAHELVAKPDEIGAFAARIGRDRPAGLAGIVWFRLPTDDDERAWSLVTWRAVLTHAPLRPALSVRTRAAAGSAAADVVLVNAGTADASLPSRIRLDSTCEAADGINGYTLDRDAQNLVLRRTQDGLLRAGRQRTIGWIRCTQPTVTSRVDP
ncbi:DUF3142 domain-containing protein [Paraburkholderia acidicola]|uniref:DUF3142 domain-containing protein n=1 Tax=Paraburkholderia acidicola TaxID=1912599 RepID=A0ABV1LXP0_9BURK